MNKQSIKCWAAINKNGFLVLFENEPKRNEVVGKWEGKLYVNSLVYNALKDLVERANLSWNNEPEYFEFEPKAE